MTKRLYKSTKNKMIEGVCGGIAEYFNMDPSLVRILTVILAICWGSGIILYIVCACIFPKDIDLNN